MNEGIRSMQKLIDPVCGMRVGRSGLRAEGYDDIAFCASICRDAFLADPARYVKLAGATRTTVEPPHSPGDLSDPNEETT